MHVHVRRIHTSYVYSVLHYSVEEWYTRWLGPGIDHMVELIT